MAIAQVYDLLLEKNRDLTSVVSDLDSPITTYFGQTLYAVIKPSTLQAQVLDVSKLLRKVANIDWTVSYRTFIVDILTNLDYLDFIVDHLPSVDKDTGNYLSRIATSNVLSEELSCQFVDVDDPTTEGVTQKAPYCYDLVIRSLDGKTDLSNSLIFVNGVLHQTVLSDGSLYVFDGYQNLRLNRAVDIVRLDTTAIGGHTTIPITADMVVGSDLSHGCYVTLPDGVTLDGVTPLLVIDGYLHALDATYQVSNHTTLKINTNLIDIVGGFINNPNHRYTQDIFGDTVIFDPLNNQSYTSVNSYTHPTDATDQYLSAFVSNRTISVETLESEDFIKSRLTSTRSFVILLKNPYIYKRTFDLYSEGDRNVYQYAGAETPRGIGLVDRGFVQNYLCQEGLNGINYITIEHHECGTNYFERTAKKTVVVGKKFTQKDVMRTPYAKLIDLYAASPITADTGT